MLMETVQDVGTKSSKTKVAQSDGLAARKDKKAVKRLWLPWEFCKLIEPPNDAPVPPFGQEKPYSVTDDEQNIMASESETLFPVGFYDMTPAKRGVTKGRGDWKGKEALRLAHCSAEKNGCLFKARFCRIANGMEIFTSGTHNIEAHLTPRKRGLAPAARAIVTKYKEESQSKLVEWLKDGGLLENAGDDLEKVKQQIKRRKMTLKRKQKRIARSAQGEEDDSQESGEAEEEEDDPLYSAKINMLQDDSFVSLVDPPRNVQVESPRPEHCLSADEEEDLSPGEYRFLMESNPFGECGPYSPTTVMINDYSPSCSFYSTFDTSGALLDSNDIFPRTSYDYALPHRSAIQRDKHLDFQTPIYDGLDPSGSYYLAEV